MPRSVILCIIFMPFHLTCSYRGVATLSGGNNPLCLAWFGGGPVERVYMGENLRMERFDYK